MGSAAGGAAGLKEHHDQQAYLSFGTGLWHGAPPRGPRLGGASRRCPCDRPCGKLPTRRTTGQRFLSSERYSRRRWKTSASVRPPPYCHCSSSSAVLTGPRKGRGRRTARWCDMGPVRTGVGVTGVPRTDGHDGSPGGSGDVGAGRDTRPVSRIGAGGRTGRLHLSQSTEPDLLRQLSTSRISRRARPRACPEVRIH